MGLVGAAPIYESPVAGEPLRLRDDGHWSTKGLVGYWPMREMRGGMTQDFSGFGNHGTFVNGPTWVAREQDRGIFCGEVEEDRYISSDGAIPPVDAITIILYGRPINFSGYPGIAQVNGFDLRFRVGRNFQVIFYRTLWEMDSWWWTEPDVITEGEPFTVAFPYTIGDFSAPVVWVNGMEHTLTHAGGKETDWSVEQDTGRLWFGRDQAGGSHNAWSGDLYGAGIYDRALSADEIAALCAYPDLPLWRPRRGISLALVGAGGAVRRAWANPGIGPHIGPWLTL